MSQCVSVNKCKRTCESMGATSFRYDIPNNKLTINQYSSVYPQIKFEFAFRWFFDGCCECVGSTCINYGINESRCTLCPEAKEEDLLDDLSQDELDFGENHLA